MSDLQTPRPCPFCGRLTKIQIQESTAIFPAVYWVRCGICMGKGPNVYSQREAVEAWNGGMKEDRAELRRQYGLPDEEEADE